MKLFKKYLRFLASIVFGIFTALIILECVLRIWHPFHYTVVGDQIILPSNIHVKMKNVWIKKLDDTIYYNRNSIGFRGDEISGRDEKAITIITVGGSTTECKFLSDSNTWPEQLKKKLDKADRKVWINNAGLDGHSTFGHIVLMNDYVVKLHPEFVLFLVGTNDIELKKSGDLDDQDIKGIHGHSVKYFLKSIINYSELGRVSLSLYRNYLAYRKGLIHKDLTPSQLLIGRTDSSGRKKKLEYQREFLVAYEKRLRKLDEICKENRIVPVFITQPALFGDVIDSTTNIYLGNLMLNDYDCVTNWKVLQLYNDKVRDLRKDGIAVIDLANSMPKNSKYFYDFMHYTNQGAAKVAAILSDSLQTILTK